MTTPAELIRLALIDAGIFGRGQTADAEDTNNAFTRLNWMLSQWSRKRWLVYHLIDVVCESTGALSYSVGSGGDFDTIRPDRIESAFARQISPQTPNPVDYPLTPIPSREDYNRIVLKNMGTWPALYFYDSGYPEGQLYVWPLPAAGQFDLHISVKKNLDRFTSLAQEIEFPPEYEAALFQNLVVQLRAAYQLAADPVRVGLAKDALAVLRGANAQIPMMQMPSAVVGKRRFYNVYSDS